MDVHVAVRAVKGFIPVGFAWLVAAACSHTTAIVQEEKDPKQKDEHGNQAYLKLPGIPFYPKKGVCNERSVWMEPQYTLSFTVKADDQPPVMRTLVVSRAGYLAPTTQDLIKTLTSLKSKYTLPEINPSLCPASLGDKWDAVARLVGTTADYQPQTGLDLDQAKLMRAEGSGNALLVANEAKVGVAPDYSHHEYLNTKSPWNGSAQVDAKIADDGTLSEGSVQRDDETINALAALVGDFTGVSTAAGGAPSAQPATAAAAGSKALTPDVKPKEPAKKPKPLPFCAATQAWPGVRKHVDYEYQLKTSLYKHDHHLQIDFVEGKCEMHGALYAGNFSVTLVDTDASSKSDNSISFSGQVKLPEDSGKKKDQKASPK
jgi:hypothetical protein